MQRINLQPIEKRDTRDPYTIDVHSLFYTIQGEGPFAGRPAVFLRLAGCNLQCPGCDTEYTEGRRKQNADTVVQAVKDNAGAARLVVITGGEPFRQNISYLCASLVEEGFTVQVETNGTLAPPPYLSRDVVIICSPKSGKINKDIAERMTALKYVLHADEQDERDGLPLRALGHSAHPTVAKPPQGFKGQIYLQPMDVRNVAQNQRNIAAVRDACLKFGYTLQLQIHKIIGVE